MKIQILCVGKLKETYLKDAVREYSKRLSSCCSLEIIELKDERIPDPVSEGEKRRILETEGKRLLSSLAERSFLVALAIDGEEMSSEGFAARIDGWGKQGIGRVAFLIGGSLGLSEEILSQADLRLSFSRMTFPHQLMRVILLEQLYRAHRINAGAPYHK